MSGLFRFGVNSCGRLSAVLAGLGPAGALVLAPSVLIKGITERATESQWLD